MLWRFNPDQQSEAIMGIGKTHSADSAWVPRRMRFLTSFPKPSDLVAAYRGERSPLSAAPEGMSIKLRNPGQWTVFSDQRRQETVDVNAPKRTPSKRAKLLLASALAIT